MQTTSEKTESVPVPKSVISEAPKSVKWLRGLAAILTVLFMGSILLNFYYYSKFAECRRKLNNWQQQQTQILTPQK